MLTLPKLRRKEYREHLYRFVHRVLERKDIVGILLFGSVAKGLEKPFPESDIDVLVVARNLPKNICRRRIENLRYKDGAESVEDIWLTPKELLEGIEGGWGVLLDAVADGIIIYDKEGLLKKAKTLVLKKFKRIGKVWILKQQP